MAIRTHNNGSRHPFTAQIVAKGVFASATLTGATTLDKFSGQCLLLDPGGAGRTVTLPPVEDGLFFWIVNAADAAETITVKNAAAVTIGAVDQSEEGIFFCDTAGWHLFRVATIALT